MADSVSDPEVTVAALIAVAFCPVGFFLVRRRGRDVVAFAVLATGIGAVLWLVSRSLPIAPVMLWVQGWAWWLPVIFASPILFVFPRASSPWGRRLAAASLACGSGALVAFAVVAPWGPEPVRTAPLAAGDLIATLFAVGLIGVVLLLDAVAVALLARRFARADGLLRKQLACLIPGGLLLPVGLVGFSAGLTWTLAPGIVAIPVGIGVAIMGYQLHDLDLEVNRRRLVAASQVVGVTLQFIVAVLLLEFLRGAAVGWVGAVLTVVGVRLEAGRRWAVRALLVALFGHREQPLLVIERVGSELDRATTSEAALRSAAETIARSLRLPYARVVIEDRGGKPLSAAEYGRNVLDVVVYPLESSGRRLGHLEVTPRARGERFTRREDSLIKELVRHVSAVADVLVLNQNLQSAREGLVLAREEERLRLRGDLHDGLGPLLAGTRMQLHLAKRTGNEAQQSYLDEAIADLASAAATIRELIHSLRPAALDHGLIDALAASGSSILPDKDVVLSCHDDLGDIPPAAEVAAYRIVSEALTNVAKHASQATRCEISVSVGDELRLVVADDGQGSRERTESSGVGVASMMARAEELGGHVVIDLTDHGTVVEAVIPLNAGRA